MTFFLLLVQTLLSIAIASLYIALADFIPLGRLAFYSVGIVLLTSALVSGVLLFNKIANGLAVEKRRVLMETPFGNLVEVNDEFIIEK